MLRIKNLSLVTIMFFPAIFGCSQNGGGGIQTTPDGLRYEILEDVEGEPATVGQIMTFEMEMLKDDSLMVSTYETGQPVVTPVNEPGFKGAVEEGLMMLSEGDSAFFQVSMDSLFKGRIQNMPPFLKNATYLSYRIKVLKIQTQEERKAEMLELQEKQKDTDDQLIRDYLEANSIEAERTESGIYYTITEEGNGENPTLDNSVTVHYTGRLLNGSVFDSSIPGNKPGKQVSGDPITFPLRGVVQGWQEGIPLISKGGKGFLYLPSHLAYGSQSPSPDIPPNSVLVFEVELIDFK